MVDVEHKKEEASGRCGAGRPGGPTEVSRTQEETTKEPEAMVLENDEEADPPNWT